MNLYEQGIDEAAICAYGEASSLREVASGIGGMRLEFYDEPLPVGNAGCVRDTWDGDPDTIFLVLHAAMMSPPDVGSLLEAHRLGGSHLTVMLGSAACEEHTVGQIPELYVCDAKVIEYMPPQGYFDMKEGLIPAMVKARQTVAARVLPRCTCGFRDRRTYLSALGHWLESGCASRELESMGLVNVSDDLWLAADAVVDSGVAIHGPVVALDKVRICSGAVIFGPAILEPDVTVGRNAVLDNCVIWSGACIGPNAHVGASVVGSGGHVEEGAVVDGDAILPIKTPPRNTACLKGTSRG